MIKAILIKKKTINLEMFMLFYGYNWLVVGQYKALFLFCVFV